MANLSVKHFSLVKWSHFQIDIFYQVQLGFPIPHPFYFLRVLGIKILFLGVPQVFEETRFP